MGTPAASEYRDVQQRIRDLERKNADLVTATLRRQPVDAKSLQVDLDIATTTDGAWVQQPYSAVTIPDGFNLAVVQMNVWVGATFTAAGQLSIQPLFSTNNYLLTGPPISTGVPSAAPLSLNGGANWAAGNLGLAINLGVMLRRAGNVQAGSMNYHISASIIFLR